MSDNAPITMPELLRRMTEGSQKFEALIDSLTDEQLTRRGPDGGWSAKDHVAHLAMWENGVAALLRREPRWEAMGVSAEAAANSDEDELNAIIHSQHQHLSVDEARDLFQRSHRALLSALEPLRDEDLVLPYSDFQPDSPSKTPIMALIAGNTWEHYAEHTPWIQAVVSAQQQ